MPSARRPGRRQRRSGYTPLHVAAEAGRTHVVRMLLDRGADVNLLTHGQIGAPALHLAECAAAPRWHKCCGRPARWRRQSSRSQLAWLRRVPSVGERSRAIAWASHGQPSGQQAHGRPNPVGVVGRAPALLPRFEYSSALQRLGGVWHEEALNTFVAHPKATAPGTHMQFDGLANAEERAAPAPP